MFYVMHSCETVLPTSNI